MIVVFWLLLVLGLGRCQDSDLPSSSEIENSINRTIEEVERMARQDPSLPQLTRREIVNILLNITAKEVDSYKDKDKIDKARKMYQKALMVVLPYNANDSPENLTDLYTKPPMTQIVPDILSSDKIEPDVESIKKEEAIGSRDLSTTKSPESSTISVETSPSPSSHKSSFKENQPTTVKNRYKNHRDTYSEVHTKVPLKEALKLDSAPVRFSFNLENLQKDMYTTQSTTTTRSPVYRKEKPEKENKDDRNIEIVYSTSITTDSTTSRATSEDISIDLTTSEYSEPGSKSNQNVLSSDQWKYNPPPASTSKPAASKFDKYGEKMPFFPTTIKILPEDGMVPFSTRKPDTGNTKEPDMIVEPAEKVESENSIPLYVTPMSSATSSQKPKYSSTYSLNSGGFRTAVTTTALPMRQEVMDLLASIGLRPDNYSNVEDVYKKNKNFLEKVRIPDTNSVIHTAISGLTSVDASSSSIVNQNTFESPGSEIKKGVQNLSPDVQLLFQRFGLQTSNLDDSVTTTTRKTTVMNSYTNFKPLPTSDVKDQEMKEFLAKFGLGVNDDKRQRAMRLTTQRPSLLEAVPSNMRGILENVGLIPRPRKVQKPKEDMESTETSKLHVFKPHEANVKTEEQRRKINELLDKVRMVQEGKVSIEDVQKTVQDLLQNAKTLQNGPDPLSLEEIIRIYTEDMKNEVKRQEEPTTTAVGEEDRSSSSPSNATESSSEITSHTMTDSLRSSSDLNPSATESPDATGSETLGSTTSTNLLALEESFGGTTKEPDPVIPANRKSGLYFLVDWNTFLEVGEEEQEKINIRFEPKVGDRTRFLPVTVP